MDREMLKQKYAEIVKPFYSSRLIIVDRVISDYLKTIAQEEGFLSIISDIMHEVDYNAELKKAISRDGIGSFFLLPQSDKRIVALVTGLLYEFDNGTKSIVGFVTGFFPAETVYQSYVTFCERIITPYAEAFYRILCGEPDVVDRALSDDDIGASAFPDKAKEDCEYWAKSLLDVIIGDNSGEESMRRECVTLTNGFLYVLDSRNPLLIKLVFIGLKNTLSGLRSTRRELNEITSILKMYGVID